MNSNFLGFVFISVGVYLLARIFYGFYSGRNELFNFYTVFTSGIVVFQFFSPGVSLITKEYYGFFIVEPEIAGLKLLIFILLFYAIFSVSYKYFKRKGIKQLSISLKPAIESKQIRLAFILSLLALFLRLFVDVPYIKDLVDYFSIGLLSYACAIAGWTFGKGFRNRKYIFYVILILIVAVASTLIGTFGRRSLVGVLICFIWGVYFSNLELFKNLKYIFSLIIISSISLILIAGITSTREHASVAKELSLKERIDLLKDADFEYGLIKLFSGQDTGAASMWIIENYPQKFSYNYFGSLLYAVLYPIPRGLWDDKPIALSNTLHYQAGFRANLEDDYRTRGPGIVGHSIAEGGLITLVLYGYFFGLVFGLVDRVILNNSYNLVAISIFSVAVGYLLGLPRGDLGAGLFRIGFMQVSVLLLITFLYNKKIR